RPGSTLQLPGVRILRGARQRRIPSPPIIVRMGAGPTRVVLTDDDVLLREGLAGLLQRSGFLVVGQAGSAGELLELVRRQQPDLATVDIRMPPTHTSEGLDAASAIRRELPDVAIVVLTAHVQVEPASELLASGMRTGYLLKTRITDVDEFIDTVRRIV